MVYFTAVAAAAVAALMGTVSAKDCQPGERICGWTLLSDEYGMSLHHRRLRGSIADLA